MAVYCKLTLNSEQAISRPKIALEAEAISSQNPHRRNHPSCSTPDRIGGKNANPMLKKLITVLGSFPDGLKGRRVDMSEFRQRYQSMYYERIFYTVKELNAILHRVVEVECCILLVLGCPSFCRKLGVWPLETVSRRKETAFWGREDFRYGAHDIWTRSQKGKIGPPTMSQTFALLHLKL